jgi:hypothetical protein
VPRCRMPCHSDQKLFACDASLTEAKRTVLKTNIAPLNCASFDCRYAFQLVCDSQQVKPQKILSEHPKREYSVNHKNTTNFLIRLGSVNIRCSDTRQVKAIFLFSDVRSSTNPPVNGKRVNITGVKAAGS